MNASGWRAVLGRLRSRLQRRPKAPEPEPPRRLRNAEPWTPGYLHAHSVRDTLAWRRMHGRPPRRW